MKKLACITVTASLFMTLSNSAMADSKEECVKMVKKAGDFLAANGKDKLIAEVNNQKGAFASGEIYLFASEYVANFDINKDRTITLAHGANPKLVGKDLTDLKDADGVFFTRKWPKSRTARLERDGPITSGPTR